MPPPAALPHWFGESVETYSGPIHEILERLPDFSRGPFGANPRHDVIYRQPRMRGEAHLPVGIVSKRYVLIQHVQVLTAVAAALRHAGIDMAETRCRLTMVASGARMALRVRLPRAFAYTAPDGHTMALTFECFNSVDRTVPLFALLGWFRFVCRNGLVVGTTHARLRQRHVPPLRVADLGPVLERGLEAATAERAEFARAVTQRVSTERLRAWVDGPVARAWGVVAAARTYAIVSRGVDGDVVITRRRERPHERELRHPVEVPGANAPGGDVYAAAQALAWLAAARQNVAERIARRAEIPDLIAHL